MNIDYSVKLLNAEARSLSGKRIERTFVHADINELKRKIHSFQNMDILSLSDKELEDNIYDVLSVEVGGGTTISNTLLEYSLFGVGERFYRVRKLKNTDMPNCDLKKVFSYWNPPTKKVKHYGRLNKPRESLLYTALNPYTAMCEANLQSGDPFVLCIYESIKPLRFSWIGGKANYDFNGIKNRKTIEFLETIRQFLVDEFTRIIPEGQESLYRITETIAKNYYTCPNDHGWRYPSIKNSFQDNICFRSERVMYKIKLVGALIAIFNESNETDPHKIMSIEHIVTGTNMDKYYRYDTPKGEECMKKLFPEFLEKQPKNT